MKLNLVRFFVAAVLALVCQPALAEKRVAMVIGNSAYQNVPSLTNPVNDSALIAAKLKEAGFDVVTSRHDLTALETRRALRDFEDSARDADIAVVYYAGHGIEVDGTNYLIPVDAKLERDSDVYDEALSLDRVLFALEPAKQLRLVILDACRDNPFAQSMKRTVASRSIGRGLAKVEPTSPNTLIAYSAKAGSTAQDGDGKDSPFTIALGNHLTTPGLDVRKAFGFVRDDVLKSTGNRQEPFVYGSLGGEDVALVPAPAAPSVASQAAPSPQSDARHDYELAMQVGNKDALTAFLAQYPDGFYATLARSQLEKIAAQQTTQRSSEPSRPQQHVAERNGPDRPSDALPPAAPPVPDKAVNVAALSSAPPAADLTKSVQLELRRVGCLTADADGNWGATSQRSLSQFNRYAGTKLDTKVAGLAALDAIKQKQSRVCPLVCGHGFKADGGHCTKIVCAEGTFLNDDNECVKLRGRTPVAKRDSYERPASEPQRTQPGASRAAQAPHASGQIICNDLLCRAVRPGCHLEANSPYALKGSGGTAEICH